MAKKKIVVIGAGIAGLSAATLLAKAGHDVTLLEKNAVSGGRIRPRNINGYRFEAAETAYMQPEIFEELFYKLDKKISDYYELLKPETRARFFFSGNQSYDLGNALDSKILFSQLEPGASVELERLLLKSGDSYDKIANRLLTKKFIKSSSFAHRFSSLIKLPLLQDWRYFITKERFHDPRLQQILLWRSIFQGADPKKTSALGAFSTYSEIELGSWYPKGGFEAVVKGLEKIAKSYGVKIRYKQPVKKIICQNNTVKSVETNRRSYECDILVSTGDLHHIEAMLPEDNQSYPSAFWQKKKAPLSVLTIHVGTDVKLDNLKPFNLFFDTNWNDNMRSLFKQDDLASEPLFIASVPSKIDKTAAPEDGDSLNITVPLNSRVKLTDEMIEKLVHDIYLRIGERAQVDLAKHAVELEVITPRQSGEMFNTFQNNGFGLSYGFGRLSALQPRIKSKKLSNLFYAGRDSLFWSDPSFHVKSALLVTELVEDIFE